MCQASGYKLTSNKELPSQYQEFAQLIPETGESNGADAPDGNQRRPMYSIVDVNGNSYKIALARLENILTSKYAFKQNSYGTEDVEIYYAGRATDSIGANTRYAT